MSLAHRLSVCWRLSTRLFRLSTLRKTCIAFRFSPGNVATYHASRIKLNHFGFSSIFKLNHFGSASFLRFSSISRLFWVSWGRKASGWPWILQLIATLLAEKFAFLWGWLFTGWTLIVWRSRWLGVKILGTKFIVPYIWLAPNVL